MTTPKDFEELFDGFDPSVHADEAQQRWGDTPAHQESQRRVKQYGKAAWAQLGAEAAAINQRLVARNIDKAAPGLAKFLSDGIRAR